MFELESAIWETLLSMRRCLSTLFFAALVCSITVSQSQGQSDQIDKIVRDNFAGFHVLSVPERDSDAKAFIVAHFGKRNPSVVHADFDGDGQLDYALLLKANESRTARFVILLCADDEHCKKASDEDISSYAGAVLIKTVPIGRYVSQSDAVETKYSPPARKLTSTGVEVTYFGQAKVVYYWNTKHKKIETIQTGD